MPFLPVAHHLRYRLVLIHVAAGGQSFADAAGQILVPATMPRNVPICYIVQDGRMVCTPRERSAF